MSPPNEPLRIARLPHDRHGRPVPWFVAWLDADGHPVDPGHGTPDFRVIRPGGVGTAIVARICWVCGELFHRQERRAWLIGPMCAVNRVTAEPPAHHECAVYSAKACPFLTTPNMVRRDRHIPPGTAEPAGLMIRRNPGVALVWITRASNYTIEKHPGGLLFRIGEPEWCEWYAAGRGATRGEVLESILTGMPTLAEACDGNEAALMELDRAHAAAVALVPK